MTQLIDNLTFLDPPGRIIQVFKFEGTNRDFPASAPNGKLHKTPNEEPQSILIAAQTAWVAHTFIKVHIPSMLPDKITSLGKVWFAPDIEEDDWTPPEYENSEEPVSNKTVG